MFRLDIPIVKISEDNILQDTLSDLELDPENVTHQDKMRYVKEAGVDKMASKWMSQRKVWTSGEVSHCSSNRHRCKDLHIVISA